MTFAAVLVMLSFAGGAQVPPPPPPPPQAMVRDPSMRPPVETTGTGSIRGRVVAADTGNPIRRANVSLSFAPPPAPVAPAAGSPPAAAATPAPNAPPPVFVRPKTATTNAQGVFEFTGLPPGSYRLYASPSQYAAGYLSIGYGAKKPSTPGSSDPGTTIDLTDGQSFGKATIALPRGAAITGRVTDENGDPLARVQVYTVMYPPGSSRGIRTGANGQTDDLGQFRLFGLAPGEYVVAAEARGNTFVPPNAPPESEEDKIGFLTTYYPGTPDEMGAQRVRTRTGAETPGIEIRLVSGRLFHLGGMVTDSQGRFMPRANGTLYRRASGTQVIASTFGFSSDEQGRFQMRNIPPGNYRLTVRQQQNGPRNPDGSFIDPGEFASMPVTINTDVDNILVVTSPGATISGTVVFENGPPQNTGTGQPLQMRVSAMNGDPENMIGMPTPPPVVVSPDLNFTMRGLAGEILLRSTAPNNTLKAVTVNGEDITDTPHEFKNGERVTLVLTSRASTLEGTVTDAAGKPTNDAALILFSDDKATWRVNSIRVRRSGADAAGHFRIQGVLAGRYFLLAIPRDRMSGLNLGNDASLFEALSKEATTVVVGEDEQRQVDVKVSPGGGGVP